MNDIFGLYGPAAIIVIIGLIAAAIFTLIVVGWMAEQRGRSVVGWILIALFICTPILAMVCFSSLGKQISRESRG